MRGAVLSTRLPARGTVRKLLITFFSCAICSAESAAPETLAVLRTPDEPIVVIGGVSIDAEARSVTFEAKGCLTEGAVEYLLVHSSGKTHESVLTTDVSPRDIHVSMLLLGANDAEEISQDRSAQYITNELLAGSSKPEGTPVEVRVTWIANGREAKHSAGSLVENTQSGDSVEESWIYTGSRIAAGSLLSQESGSIISLVADPEALINFAGKDRIRDDVWAVNGATTPKPDQVVKVTIKILQDPEPKPDNDSP